MMIKMQLTIYYLMNIVMNNNKNPLKNIPDTQVRHIIMQVLAWMWSLVFSMCFIILWIFGITTISYTMLLAAIVFTVLTFEIAKRKPRIFSSYYTSCRSYTIHLDGKRMNIWRRGF